MKTYLVSLLLCTTLLYTAKGQKKMNTFNANDIRIEWQVIENNYMGRAKYLSAFTFTNTSKKALPAKGWSIYFSLPRNVDTTFTQKDFKIIPVNGDLMRIVPNATFKGLAPGVSSRFEFLGSDWTLNRADAPSGLYLVWDNDPETGITLNNYTIKPSTSGKQLNRNAGDHYPINTAALVYNNNKDITAIPAAKLCKIFPTPIKYVEQQGFFDLTAQVGIATNKLFENEASYLATELQHITGQKPLINPTAKGNKTIQLVKADMPMEAYQLSINKDRIIISAGSAAGIFYGIQSLKSLLPASAWSGIQKSIPVPAVEVSDAPRFPWRAFMLDVGRNFQSKQQILKMLDLLSLYKINVFHFHFNEDEGWRIAIPGLPELTEIGGKRGHKDFDKIQLPPSFGSGPNNNSSGSGFYTQADFIEILKYAHKRHIKVIPEIESPGHARAAVVAMNVRYERLLKEGKKEEAEKYMLRLPNDRSIHHSVQGWNDNVMDVSLPSTYRFLEKVTDGFIAMYKEAGVPFETIHMGGDEVPAGSWEKSPAFEKLKQTDSSIKTTDDLWYYYYNKVNKIVKTRGLFLYGWEEVGMHKVLINGSKQAIPNPDLANQNIHLDVWNNLIGWGSEDLAYKLANAGYKVVLSPVSNVYFDMSYNKSFDEEGYYWGGFVDVDKPFSFIPFDYLKNTKQDRMGNDLPANFKAGKEQLTELGKSNIVGVQGLLWSETITSAQRMEYMILPKLLGLAERAWAPNPEWAIENDEAKATSLYNNAWSEFINVLGQRELPRLDHYAGGFKYRIPTAGAIAENGVVKANVQLPGFSIRYTTDGTVPSIKSKPYKEPITEKGTIKFKVFNHNGRGGRIETINN